MLESEYPQYGRQMIVPEIGLEGQTKIRASRVLVVGAGGLGSPAIAYLAGAGVGTLGIVDPDLVEVSNLHRQVIHSRATIGMPKCSSAAKFVRELNPSVEVKEWFTKLDAENALEIVDQFDLVLDCTDSPMSRYLVNDASVLCGKPLVSASALKMEGQLSVYNYKNGPCYRCIFPVPPPPRSVGACSDAGIFGPVVGMMGVLQATEALKIVACKQAEFTPSLLLYSSMSFPSFRTMKLRSRKPECSVCGQNPSITRQTLADQNYVEFCGSVEIPSLEPSWRIEPKQAAQMIAKGTELLDVRPKVQFDIAHIPGSRNVPLASLASADLTQKDYAIVCRYGNDSRLAVKQLRDRDVNAWDVSGGLSRWRKDVDSTLPDY